MQIEQEEETKKYFVEKVNPIFSELMITLIKSRPENILGYSCKWFQKINKKQSQDLENDDMVLDEVFKGWRKQRIEKGLRKNRLAISSEVYGPFCKRTQLNFPKQAVKQQQTEMRILFSCTNSFLFKNFNQQELNILIRMMNKVVTKKDEVIINEEEYEKSMYFIDEGIYEWCKNTEKGKTTLKYIHVGQTFGDIFLLHHIQHFGTVISRSEGILYKIERETYKHFKKMSVVKKRTLYLLTLKKQSLFNSFTEEELQKICDVLSEISYKEGELIINEGDYGSNFYIIIEGILVAFKEREQNVVQCYKEGDAFGELALIKDVPRQASIKSLTKTKLVFLTQQTFKRIFAKINLEKEVQERYVRRQNCINQKRKD